MTTHHDDREDLAEPLKVGDLVPATLERARRKGETLGRQRATRTPKTKPKAQYVPKGKTGRPIRLHDALTDRICQAIEDGSPIQAAAVANGVPKSTFHSWQKRGQDARSVLEAGGEVDQKELIFLEFLTRVEGARDHAMVQAIQAHQRLAFGGEVLEVYEKFDPDDPEVVVGRTIRFSKPDRMALEWYLERSHPHLFGTRRLEVTGEDGGPIPVEVEVSARDVLRRKLEQVATRIGVEDDEEEAGAS